MTATTTEAPTTHRAETPRLEGVPNGLQPEDLDRLVGSQADLYQAFEADESSTDFDEFLKARIDEKLRAAGFDPDSEDEQAREDYNFARGIYETAISANKTEWLGVPEGQRLNRRELVADAVAEWYEPRLIESRYEGRHRAELASETHENGVDSDSDSQSTEEAAESEPTADETSENSLSNGSFLSREEHESAHDDMNELLDKYAQKVAKRSRSVVESAKTGAAIEAAGNELSDILSGLASEMYADLAAQGVEHHQIVRTVDQFVTNATENTLAKVEQYRLSEYNNSRPYVQKLYDKWAEWSEDKRWFSKGKLKKAAVFAVPSAALGVALAPLVGAVGAGVLTGAAAAAGGRSIARHLANGFMKKRDKRYAEAQTDEMRAELTAIYEGNDRQNEARNASTNDRIIPRPAERNLDLIEFVNQRSREYRVRNRNRLLAGTAIAMSVGLLSATAADALNGGLDIHNPFGGHGTKPGGEGTTPQAPGDQLPVPGQTLLPKLDWSDFSHESRIVEPGEGGFQTLKEMGIPENKWEAIWQDAGAKLHAEGKTYTMNDGRWGWDRTMTLSDRDLNIIARAAQRNGVSL